MPVYFAPAKINLYLEVPGKQEDGYHLLDSLVAFSDIGDEIQIQPAATFRFCVSGPFAKGLPVDETNLAVKAALLFSSSFPDERKSISLHLIKNLPVASGIGGGSSDAAAVLRGLCKMQGIPVDSPKVMEIAKALGADVPMCVLGQTAHIGGIGEIITPVSALPDCAMVLVNPGAALSTPDVFRVFASGRFNIVIARRQQADEAIQNQEQINLDCRAAIAARNDNGKMDDLQKLISMLSLHRNDLEPAAISLCPVIETVLEEIWHTPNCLLARMSGSGATCFGLYETQTQASLAAEKLQRENPAWWVKAGKFIHSP